MARKSSESRRAAWQAVAAWLVAERRTARLGSLHRPFPPPNLAPRNRAQAKRLAEGAVRRFASLDSILKSLARGRRIKPHGLHAALLLGAYELLFEAQTKERAIVHEAVELARLAAGEGGAGFANALLRRLARRRKLHDWLSEPEHDASYRELATWWSLPEVLVARWIAEHGIDSATQLFAAANARPNYCLRLRPQVEDLQALQAELAQSEIETTCGPHHRTLLLASKKHSSSDLLSTPAFTRGDFVIQDIASIEAVDLLDLAPGQRVLDYCAAPGGKSLAIADALGPSGTVVAWDPRWERLQRLPAETERLGISNVHAVRKRSELDEEALFDRVLVDAPCTNTGVLHKRAEARWHFDEDVLEQSCDVQRQILEQASQKLRPGGRLVYSTCSIEPEENETLVQTWAKLLGLELLSTKRVLPEPGIRDGGGVSILLKPDAKS